MGEAIGIEALEAAMASARSREGVGGLLEFVMAERTRPPLGRVGIEFGLEVDVVDGGGSAVDDEDDCVDGGGGGGGFRRFPGINRLILSGIPSVSDDVLPAI